MITRRRLTQALAALVAAPAALASSLAPARRGERPAFAVTTYGRKIEAALAIGDARTERVIVHTMRLTIDHRGGDMTMNLGEGVSFIAPASGDAFLEIYTDGAREWSMRFNLITDSPITIGQTVTVKDVS